MRFGAWLFIAVIFGVPARAGDAVSAFDVFCKQWMQKLELREQHNLRSIKWEPDPQGVQGTYVGYTSEHTCTVENGSGTVPVGKINYLEVRYRKRGGDVAEAQRSLPHPVETTEVTEIFRYGGGKWIY